MGVAELAAEMSWAQRRKVGCVITKDGNIISVGWNGMPAGMHNCCEKADPVTGELVTNPEVSHAEENAIAKLARSNQSSLGADAYVTLEPCITCSKLLYNAGIQNVFIKERYHTNVGTNYLTGRGVNVVFV